jgi:hypothetical protein
LLRVINTVETLLDHVNVFSSPAIIFERGLSCCQ